jgi:hypothetical protein
MHVRNFGFPRKQDHIKTFKWKKMNFTTDLPKNKPECTYLVATGKDETNKVFRMHAVVLSEEYSPVYRLPEVLAGMRKNNDKTKLLPKDIENGSRKIICCHVRSAEPLENQEEAEDPQNSSVYTTVGGKRLRQRNKSLVESPIKPATTTSKPAAAKRKRPAKRKRYNHVSDSSESETIHYEDTPSHKIEDDDESPNRSEKSGGEEPHNPENQESE